MHLATIRIHDTFVLSLSCRRLDVEAGRVVLDLVKSAIAQGARTVVLDFGPFTSVDFGGARALEQAAEKLGNHRGLAVAGLSSRARALLRSLRLVDRLRLVEWWADAVEPGAMAA
jgi:anti-anti-sigma regulatory factor